MNPCHSKTVVKISVQNVYCGRIKCFQKKKAFLDVNMVPNQHLPAAAQPNVLELEDIKTLATHVRFLRKLYQLEAL